SRDQPPPGPYRQSDQRCHRAGAGVCDQRPPNPFFFSSRRRHTRFSRDWSSDVCSSDLTPIFLKGANPNLCEKEEISDISSIVAEAPILLKIEQSSFNATEAFPIA